MKNKNFLKLKKVSDERYFKNYAELFDFVMKSMNVTEEHFYDMCKKYKTIENEILIPLSVLSKETHKYIRVDKFVCLITKGTFLRKSGEYKFNLLAIQKTDNLTGNDLKKIFEY
jgi:hypothetical protein